MKVNTDLLSQLYKIHHPSGQEYEMMGFIINWVHHNIKNVNFKIDHYSNLFITKNTNNPDFYPCMIAHMDEMISNKGLKNLFIKSGMIRGKKCALGADDCNGIYIILEMLKNHDDLKVIFTVEEEMGTKGAMEAIYNDEFLSNISYFIQPDRRGKSDLITETNGIRCCSQEFLDDLTPIATNFKYSPEMGTFTDVGIFCEFKNIAGINVSCGYYNEHTINEYTVISELQNSMNFINNILSNLQNKQYILSDSEMQSYYSPTTYHYDRAQWEDIYSDIPSDNISSEWHCQLSECSACFEKRCDECAVYWDWYDDKYCKIKPANKQIHTYEDKYSKCNTCNAFDCMRCEYYKSY